MKFTKELMLFSIVSVVFLAGCARGPSAPAGAGVLITSFQPDLSEVDGETEVTFTLAVKNTGEREASNVVAKMFGLSSEWKQKGADGKGAEFNTDFTSLTSDIGKLAGVDPSVGFEGEDGTADFEVKAAKSKSTEVTYDASVRVAYTYETVSDTVMRIVQASYLKTNPNVQKGVVSSSSTGGPLLVTVVARTPVVTSGQNARIQFEIQNVGGGRVFGAFKSDNKEIDDQKLDRLTSIEFSASQKIVSCAGVSAGEKTFKLTDSDTVSLRLVGGKSKVISCEITTGTIANFQDLTVTAKIKYNYFVDAPTTVTVLKEMT